MIPEQSVENVFDVVNQFNLGLALSERPIRRWTSARRSSGMRE